LLDPRANDRQIVDAVLAGDRDAFRLLVERESRMVINACHRILGNPIDAQEAAQEAFVRAYQLLATFRGDGPFGAWVRRIAVRVAIARLAAGDGAVSLDDGRRHVAAVGDRRSAPDPVDWILDDEERDALRDAVAHLPPDQRDVVMLRFFGERSVEEIARITDRPVGTVKSRLSRGVATLRDQFDTRSAP
jgi:RNA polymerase sigma-70 factor (ECF subfamily)